MGSMQEVYAEMARLHTDVLRHQGAGIEVSGDGKDILLEQSPFLSLADIMRAPLSSELMPHVVLAFQQGGGTIYTRLIWHEPTLDSLFGRASLEVSGRITPMLRDGAEVHLDWDAAEEVQFVHATLSSKMIVGMQFAALEPFKGRPLDVNISDALATIGLARKAFHLEP